MINMVRGLTLVEPSALELLRSYVTNDFQVMWKLRLPNAPPYFFNALKVCSTLILIGAVGPRVTRLGGSVVRWLDEPPRRKAFGYG